MVAVEVRPRNEIPKQHTWNAESVFATQDAWQQELVSIKESLPQISEYVGTLDESPAKLADWLEWIIRLGRRVNKLMFYAVMSLQVDSNNEAAKAMVGQGGAAAGQFNAASAFARPEMLAIGEETLLSWVKSEPRLAMYEHYFNDLLKGAAHVRSSEVEEVLGMVSEPFNMTSQISGALTNTDMTFGDAIDAEETPHPVTQSGLEAQKHSADREIRRTAWQNYADGYLAFKNTLAATYLASVKQAGVMAKARKFESTLHMILEPNNIPVAVFHNLVDTYKKHIPVWHRFWDVKRRVLGLDSIHPYDIWAPMTTNEPEIPYEKAVDWIAEGMTPLGDEYVAALRKGCLEDRWVDVYPNRGKRQGAFSYGTHDTHPFIMMSYNDRLNALSTLAHELGHSMHSYFSRKTQPSIYSGYSLFAAEVASNFNQALVRAYLFEKYPDRDFQLALIDEAMGNFHRYFFIMPTLARFELEVHTRSAEGKPMTADILNGIMRDLYTEGYGDTMTDDPERTGITWAQFGHLYSPFYTFQYATGISAAHALADGILSSKDGAVDNYLSFLRAGGSMYPLDALKMAGVDLSTPQPVERAFEVLTGLVDRLEGLI